MAYRPFALWRLAPADDTDTGVGHAPLPPVLAEFEWVYDGLAERGWDASEVDEWPVYRCARRLGLGPVGDDTKYRQVLRGSRGVGLSSDGDEPEGEAWKTGADSALQERLRMYDEAEASGQVVQGRGQLVRPPSADG